MTMNGKGSKIVFLISYNMLFWWCYNFFSALYPVCQETDAADRNTREFLHRVIDILLDYVTTSNDRSKKILDFHHPEQMRESIDLKIPDKPLNLDQLLVDCKDTMKYGVRTGKFIFFTLIFSDKEPIMYYFKWLSFLIIKLLNF